MHDHFSIFSLAKSTIIRLFSNASKSAKESEKEKYGCVVGKWRIICKMKSDAEIDMNNGRPVVWIVRLTGTKHERVHWDLAERRRRDAARGHNR